MAVRAGVLVVLAAAAPLCDAAALNATSAALQRLYARHPSLPKVKEQCAAITECYCIKRTPCGWCGSYGKGMLGTADGPIDAEHCPNWVEWAEDCPTYHCEGEMAEWWWYLQVCWLPGLCFIFWLVMYCWRAALRIQHLSPPEVESLAMDVRAMVAASQATVTSENSPSQVALNYLRRQIYDTFGRKRTFEAFRKGFDCPLEERLTESVGRPYELNLWDLTAGERQKVDSSRVGPHSMWATLRVALQWRTALGASLVVTAFMMFLSALYLGGLRHAARMLPKDEYMALTAFTKGLSSVVSPLQKVVSMLLSFYVLNRLAWWWFIMSQGFVIQGNSSNIGMIAGTMKKDTELKWRKIYRLYRYVTVNMFYTYQFHTPVFKFVGFTPLVKCGLLEADEVAILKAAHRGPHSVTEAWISNWIAENLVGEARQQAFQSLRELRGAAAVLQAMCEQRAPISFESLLYLSVYCLVALIPFAPSGIDYNNRRAVMEGLHISTVVGDGILIIFYMSLLHLLRHLQSPFDDFASPNDALSPVAILNNVERKLRDYLTALDPDDLPEPR